jgi:hypothetical protein
MLSLGFQEVFLSTSVTYVERSVGYLSTEALKRTGFSPAPPAKAGQGSVPWRALRKLIRLTLLNPAGHIAGIAGAGANIEAIFRKGQGHSSK